MILSQAMKMKKMILALCLSAGLCPGGIIGVYEYPEITETFATEVLSDITGWLLSLPEE